MAGEFDKKALEKELEKKLNVRGKQHLLIQRIKQLNEIERAFEYENAEIIQDAKKSAELFRDYLDSNHFPNKYVEQMNEVIEKLGEKLRKL